MKDSFYIAGIGWVRERVINRLNADGINEPYIEIELIKSNNQNS